MVAKSSKRNPFIVTPGEFWADRERLWKRLMDYVQLAKMTRSNEIIVLVGDYGCGTTHTLRYLENFLKDKGAFVSYFTAPVRGDLSSLYEGFLRDIPPSQRRRIIDRLMDDLLARPEIRERAQLEQIPHEEIEDTILALITGERLTLGQASIARELGFLRGFPSSSEVWGRILSDLRTTEWPVFVLIDEFDAVLLGEQSSQELLFGLRRLYDETLFGMCIVIGLKGEPKDVGQKLGSAIHSRMSLQPIYVTPLSKDEGLEFLTDVLEYRYGKRKRKFLPFTEDGAKTLVDLSCPCTPRRLLRISSVVFEQARREELSRIDRDLVLEVVARFGQISISAPSLKIMEPKVEREVTAPQRIIEDVIEYGANGVPHILVNPARLTATEAIGLVLYAKRPTSLALREIQELVSRNWKSLTIYSTSARIGGMRGLVMREGKKGSYRYRLSGMGESWIERELIPHLKGEEKEEETKERRGGARRALYGPAIDELIEENYFKRPNNRSVEDVIKALSEKGLPTTSKRRVVLTALKRRLGKTLKGTKEEKRWVFWTD